MRSGATSEVSDSEPVFDLAPEDQLRVELLQLLATPLANPPNEQLLAAFGNISGDDTALGQALSDCAAAARDTTVEAEDDAYHELFIGVGTGVLVPFGSYYLTGFLHEKPLSKLRSDMAELGVEQDPDVKEPEDHIASVLELLAGLIDGRFGAPEPLEKQRVFFEDHVGSWAPHFFKDLSETRQSAFYAALGRLGAIFLEIEKKAFEYV